MNKLDFILQVSSVKAKYTILHIYTQAHVYTNQMK